MRKRAKQIKISPYVVNFILKIQANEMIRERKRPTANQIIQKLIPRNWEKYYRQEYA